MNSRTPTGTIARAARRYDHEWHDLDVQHHDLCAPLRRDVTVHRASCDARVER